MAQTTKPDYPREELTTAFGKLWESEENSDVVIKCGRQSWKAHSLIISTRSEFFSKALSSGFKESDSKLIELQNDDIWMVHRMLAYLYTLTYSDLQLKNCKKLGGKHGSTESSYVSPMRCNASMYQMGDIYGIWALKKLAAEKFEKACHAIPTDAMHKALLEVIPLIYATTPEADRGLRDWAVHFAIPSYRQLVLLPSFESVVSQHPLYALDLMKSTSQLMSWARCSTCEERRIFKPYTSFAGYCTGCEKLGHYDQVSTA